MSSLNPVSESVVAKTKIHWEDPLAAAKLSWDLKARLNRAGIIKKENQVILLCIGTDRSTGDCLGPLVGSKLQPLQQESIQVYGTLEDPVHASNIEEKLKQIYSQYKSPYIIAIDASLGSLDNVGLVNIDEGSLRPGAGVNKNLPPVGDLNITGIVNVGGFLEYLVLQNTRLNIVMKLADLIADGLKRIIYEYEFYIPAITTDYQLNINTSD